MFDVRFPTAHDKRNVFTMRLVLTHVKGNPRANGCKRGQRPMAEKLPCAKGKTHDKLVEEKTHGKLFFAERFFTMRSGKDAPRT
jgi:hypothetical protein